MKGDSQQVLLLAAFRRMSVFCVCARVHSLSGRTDEENGAAIATMPSQFSSVQSVLMSVRLSESGKTGSPGDRQTTTCTHARHSTRRRFCADNPLINTALRRVCLDASNQHHNNNSTLPRPRGTSRAASRAITESILTRYLLHTNSHLRYTSPEGFGFVVSYSRINLASSPCSPPENA